MNEFVNCQNSLPDLVQAAGEDLKIRVARVTTRGDFSLFACFNILIEGDEDNMVQQCMSIDVPLTDYWSSTGTCGPGTHWDPELSLCIPDEICLWNPDSDGDLFVGTPDLLAFLGAFGLSDPDMDGIWE